MPNSDGFASVSVSRISSLAGKAVVWVSLIGLPSRFHTTVEGVKRFT